MQIAADRNIKTYAVSIQGSSMPNTVHQLITAARLCVGILDCVYMHIATCYYGTMYL